MTIISSRTLTAPLISGVEPLESEEQFCEINLKLGQMFRRCSLKDFLPGALAALLLGGAKPFMQF